MDVIETLARATCLIVAGLAPDAPHHDRFGKATGKQNWEAYQGDAKLLVRVLSDAGHVLVPKEPTEAMLKAARDAAPQYDDPPTTGPEYWQAMIAAALPESLRP